MVTVILEYIEHVTTQHKNLKSLFCACLGYTNPPASIPTKVPVVYGYILIIEGLYLRRSIT